MDHAQHFAYYNTASVSKRDGNSYHLWRQTVSPRVLRSPQAHTASRAVSELRLHGQLGLAVLSLRRPGTTSSIINFKHTTILSHY